MKEYSVVIPAYNEEKNIAASVTQVLTFMRTFSNHFEVIVVDDGSRDSTCSIVEVLAQENPELYLIKNKHKGKGPSLYTGITSSQGKYICMADADMATPVSELKRLSVWLLEHNYDFVIASREGKGAMRNKEPFYRHVMGRVFNFLVRLLTVKGINDTQCGFKLFKRDAILNVLSKMHVYADDAPEISTAYTGAFDVEMLYLADKMGYKIKEVPVEWTYVKTERVNPLRDSYKMFSDVLKVRINDMKGLYK